MTSLAPSLPIRRIDRSLRPAFSLVEVMAVLVLIGILATAVAVNVHSYLIKGRQNAVRAELSSICTALETYSGEYGHYPSTEEGLAVLTKPSDKFSEPLLNKQPIDPWGYPYHYQTPGRGGQAFEVFSYGNDNRAGGTPGSADEDLSNWDETRAAKTPGGNSGSGTGTTH